ncbi:MAG: NAD-dependent epimerase/dehydratase family protein [Pseudomonadales bacterium]
MSKSVLVTGAFGNIGQGTISKLLDEGHTVICLDRESPETRKVANKYGKKIATVWCDICDLDNVVKAVERVDVVIHLVAIIPPLSEQNSALAERVNVEGTKTVIRAMENSPRTKRLIFASTFGVFGMVQDRTPPLLNDSQVCPTDHYGRSKVAAETAIRASSLDWSILRICAAPPLEINPGAAHHPSTLFEMSADARIEFVHPEDVSTAFCRASSCEEAIGKILFLGGGKACQMSGLEFASNIVRGNGIPGGLPTTAFKPSSVPEFYGDWVDTRESQRLLRFQNHTMKAFVQQVQINMGWKYYLVRLIAPLARRILLKSSPYL